MWVRTPALPRTAGTNADSDSERVRAAEGAVRALERAVSDAIQRLDAQATSALAAPSDVADAFRFLSTRAPQQNGESVVLFEQNRPFAWSGETRIDPDTLTSPISVTFSPFYTTLNVVTTQGERRAVASAILHASPPAR